MRDGTRLVVTRGVPVSRPAQGSRGTTIAESGAGIRRRVWTGDPYAPPKPPGEGASPSALRAEQAEQTRLRILTASAEVFAAKGYLGVSITDIVADLNLTKGAFYYFFANKEALAREIVERHFAAWREVNASTVASVENRLDAVVRMSYRAAAMFQTSPITRAGARLAREGPVIGLELPSPFRGWVDRVTAILEQAKVRGDLASNIDPSAATEMIVSFFHGAVEVSGDLDAYSRLARRLDYFWTLALPRLRPAGEAERPSL